jgi:hypothetical protein
MVNLYYPFTQNGYLGSNLKNKWLTKSHLYLYAYRRAQTGLEILIRHKLAPCRHLDPDAMNGRRCPDLSPDVLRQISSRLWDPADFIYFHAVCKSWRNSRDPLSREIIT